MIKQIDFETAIKNKDINKVDYPDALFLGEGCDIKRFTRGFKWYGFFYKDKMVGALQIKEERILRYIYIYILEIKKNKRKVGLGRDMLEEIEKYYKDKGYKGIRLTPMNNKLIGFYQHLGYNFESSQSRTMKKFIG